MSVVCLCEFELRILRFIMSWLVVYCARDILSGMRQGYQLSVRAEMLVEGTLFGFAREP